MGQTVYPELGGDSGTLRAGPNVDLVVPDVCPTSSQNLQLRSSISSSSSVQSTKHSVFFLFVLFFQGSPSNTAGYPVLFQTKQTLLQPLMAFRSFYHSCCRIPDSFHASISFQGGMILPTRLPLEDAFSFLLDPAPLLGPFFPCGCCLSSCFVPVL